MKEKTLSIVVPHTKMGNPILLFVVPAKWGTMEDVETLLVFQVVAPPRGLLCEAPNLQETLRIWSFE